MTNTQRAKLDTSNRVVFYNSKYAAELAAIEEYANEQSAFKAALTIINNAAQVQSGTAGTSKDAADATKETMAKLVTKYALRGLVKAKQLGNLTLANHLDHPVTYISQAPKTLAVQRANDITAQMNTNMATLTNITAANITEITTAIAMYDAAKDHPIIDKQDKAASGTNALPNAFGAAFKAIDNMFDLISSYFADTNKPMVDEFALAKQIINTGIHHTGVTGTVTKNGLPVKDATIHIAGNSKTATTDMDGHYTISKIKTGDYTIEAKNEAGNTQSKTVHITKGNFETLDFAL
jgi:hypothetical protein